MSVKILAAENLTLVKGRHKILDVEHFSLEQGETVALIGPNGAGKSTFLQVLMLLQRLTTGEIFFKGEKVKWKNSIAYRRCMAMVFQEPLLLDATVFHNVASGLKIRGLQRKKIQEKVKEWLEKLGIEHLAGRSARTLSGGESRRVSLARALVLEPDVFFLDEPFSALDASVRNTLIAELAAILRTPRMSSVFVTHDYTEIPLLAGRVVALEGGRVVQVASSREILARPASRTVASLVGVENIITGRVVGRSDGEVMVQAGPHTIAASGAIFPAGEMVYILLRPEDVKIAAGACSNGDNVINGEIRELLPHGCLFKAVADCGFPLITLLSPDQVMNGEVMAGKEVCLSFNPGKVHLIRKKE